MIDGEQEEGGVTPCACREYGNEFHCRHCCIYCRKQADETWASVTSLELQLLPITEDCPESERL